MRLVYDRSRDRARAAIGEAEALLRAYSREWGRGRLLLRGVAPEVGMPLQIEQHDLATPQSSGSLVLFLVAFYGLFAAVMGGVAVALDTTAGERERASLEPLLLTPARPLELAAGKWLAVCLLNLLVVVLTLAGFYLTLRFGPVPSIGIPFLFGLAEFLRFVVVLLPLILLVPAILRLRRLPRADVQGGAVDRLAAAVRDLDRADRADVPAAQGAGVARLGAGVVAVRAAHARAARRGAAGARARAVVRGAGAARARRAAAASRGCCRANRCWRESEGSRRFSGTVIGSRAAARIEEGKR